MGEGTAEGGRRSEISETGQKVKRRHTLLTLVGTGGLTQHAEVLFGRQGDREGFWVLLWCSGPALGDPVLWRHRVTLKVKTTLVKASAGLEGVTTPRDGLSVGNIYVQTSGLLSL